MFISLAITICTLHKLITLRNPILNTKLFTEFDADHIEVAIRDLFHTYSHSVVNVNEVFDNKGKALFIYFFLTLTNYFLVQKKKVDIYESVDAAVDDARVVGQSAGYKSTVVIQKVESSKKCLEQRMDLLENKLDQIFKILSESKN